MAAMMSVMDLCIEVMDRPWEWGRADCCTAAADVFKALHGIDPMAPLRGRYDTQFGAYRLISLYDGWLSMATGLAARAGLQSCVGKPSDIGLCRDHAGRLALAICTERGWVGKTETGCATMASVARAWTCRKP